ncbi:hypothetical protein JW721_01020 [Candidatus Micrarchaeota archaeon]|nr:hypothetical protein [Candidatus Micrarchaeota archaeon]
MDERLTAREIGAYIELRKKVAEEEYKLEYIKNKAGEHSALVREIEEDLHDSRSKLKIIEGKLEGRRMKVIVPNQKKIDEIGEMVARLPKDEVQDAMRNKEGDIYLYLAERGKIMRRNLENKNEIGKLNILLAGSEKDVKECVGEALRHGEPGDSSADFGGEKGKKIVRLLNRVGIRCKESGGRLVKCTDDLDEGRVVVNNEYFWIPKSKLPDFTENEKELAKVSVQLQIKNAEMQAITFNEAQQEEFKELQAQYMDHLKARREAIGSEEEELHLSI